MILNKQIIVNNFEWIIHSQPAVDIINVFGFGEQLMEVYNKIVDFVDQSDVNNRFVNGIDWDSLPESIPGDFSGIYDLFHEMNKIQNNKNTYVPNLAGIILASKYRN